MTSPLASRTGQIGALGARKRLWTPAGGPGSPGSGNSGGLTAQQTAILATNPLWYLPLDDAAGTVARNLVAGGPTGGYFSSAQLAQPTPYGPGANPGGSDWMLHPPVVPASANDVVLLSWLTYNDYNWPTYMAGTDPGGFQVVSWEESNGGWAVQMHTPWNQNTQIVSDRYTAPAYGWSVMSIAIGRWSGWCQMYSNGVLVGNGGVGTFDLSAVPLIFAYGSQPYEHLTLHSVGNFTIAQDTHRAVAHAVGLY